MKDGECWQPVMHILVRWKNREGKDKRFFACIRRSQFINGASGRPIATRLCLRHSSRGCERLVCLSDRLIQGGRGSQLDTSFVFLEGLIAMSSVRCWHCSDLPG